MALRALLLLHRRGGLLQGRAHVDRPAPRRAAGGLTLTLTLTLTVPVPVPVTVTVTVTVT